MKINELKSDAKVKLTGIYLKCLVIYLIYACITLCISFVASFSENLNNYLSLICNILLLIFSLPLSYGLIHSYMNLSHGNPSGYFSFLSDGFKKTGKLWAIVGRTILKMIMPFILIIVTAVLTVVPFSFGLVGKLASGTALMLTVVAAIVFIIAIIYYLVKLLSYSLTSYVLFDNPDATAKEIVEKSANYMDGHKWDYIFVALSFIGWYLLIGIIVEFIRLASLKFPIFLYTTNPLVMAGILVLAEAFLQPYIAFTMINFYEEIEK